MNKKMIFNSVLISLFLGVSGCSSLGGKAAPAKVTWTKHKDIPFQPQSASTLPENTANLVFFREADDRHEQTAVNIGINDRYQASLRGGNYTAVPSCAGKTKISTLITEKKINDLEIDFNAYPMNAGENYYFEVFVDNLGNSQATPVKPDVALERLKGKPLQTHTISRVVQQGCTLPEPVKPIVPAPKPEPIKLVGIYFFEFDIPTMNKSEYQRAYGLGKKILDTGRSYQVTLSGHADPMGELGYNDRLSQKRVQDVTKALVDAGVDRSRIRQAAYGELKPIELTCMKIGVRDRRNSCNLKNRRVEARVDLK